MQVLDLTGTAIQTGPMSALALVGLVWLGFCASGVSMNTKQSVTSMVLSLLTGRIRQLSVYLISFRRSIV